MSLTVGEMQAGPGPRDGHVPAPDGEDQHWSYTTGGLVSSSSAVADGTVYAGSWDHKVYALDAGTGRLRWTYTTGDTVFSGPAVADGTVYADSWDHKVYALNAGP